MTLATNQDSAEDLQNQLIGLVGLVALIIAGSVFEAGHATTVGVWRALGLCLQAAGLRKTLLAIANPEYLVVRGKKRRRNWRDFVVLLFESQH